MRPVDNDLPMPAVDPEEEPNYWHRCPCYLPYTGRIAGCCTYDICRDARRDCAYRPMGRRSNPGTP